MGSKAWLWRFGLSDLPSQPGSGCPGLSPGSAPTRLFPLCGHRAPNLWALFKPAQPLESSPQPLSHTFQTPTVPLDLVLGPLSGGSCPEQNECLLLASRSHGARGTARPSLLCAGVPVSACSCPGLCAWRQGALLLCLICLSMFLGLPGPAQLISTLFSFLEPSFHPAFAPVSLSPSLVARRWPPHRSGRPVPAGSLKMLPNVRSWSYGDGACTPLPCPRLVALLPAELPWGGLTAEPKADPKGQSPRAAFLQCPLGVDPRNRQERAGGPVEQLEPEFSPGTDPMACRLEGLAVSRASQPGALSMVLSTGRGQSRRGTEALGPRDPST